MRCASLCQPFSRSRYAATAASPSSEGSTARIAGSPKIWPIDGGVSRGSRRRNTSKYGSTESASGRLSVATEKACSAWSRRTVAAVTPRSVWTRTGTSATKRPPAWVWRSTPSTTKRAPSWRTLRRSSLHLHHRRARPRDQVVEDPPERLAADGFSDALDVAERRPPALVLAIEPRERRAERLVADVQPQRVIAHQRLAVPDRLGGRAVALAELGEREVAARAHVIAVLLQRRAPVLGGRPALFLDEVVGEVGRQAFAPVAGAVVDEHGVAPPVVQDFVRVRRVDDEGEPDDLRAEQREGRHPVAGFPEVLDQRELAVRVRADQAAVHLEVLGRGRQVLPGDRGVPFVQVHQRLDGPGAVLELVQRAADDVDLVHRPAGRPSRLAIGAAGRAVALADDVPGRRRRRRHVEGDQLGAEPRMPHRRAGQVHAVRSDEARGVAEPARVLLLRIRERDVDDPLVRERQRLHARRRCDPIRLEGHASGALEAQFTQRRGNGHFRHGRFGVRDGQRGVEDEGQRAGRGRLRPRHLVGRGQAMGGRVEADDRGGGAGRTPETPPVRVARRRGRRQAGRQCRRQRSVCSCEVLSTRCQSPSS